QDVLLAQRNGNRRKLLEFRSEFVQLLALLRSRRRVLGRWLTRELVCFFPQRAQSIRQRRSQIAGSLRQTLRLGDRAVDGAQLITDTEKLRHEAPDSRGFLG